MPYSYNKIFDPKQSNDSASGAQSALADQGARLNYVYYKEDIALAVNVAIVTGRPLLIRGPSGSGKTSLAESVAAWMNWRLYKYVVTSRTQARDMLWRFDALRRLSDAQAGVLGAKQSDAPAEVAQTVVPYIEPGVLWWAFDPASAARRGLPSGAAVTNPPQDPDQNPPPTTPDPRAALPLSPDDLAKITTVLTQGPGLTTLQIAQALASLRPWPRAIVLLDEIDKADPDVPNDLLEPLGSLLFTVAETGTVVELADRQNPPLLMITTNEERGLPNAFLRRCLTLTLERPDKDRLVEIARRRFGADDDKKTLYSAVADEMDKAPDGAMNLTPPSTAEYLDTVSACLDLKVQPNATDETWQAIRRATLWKQPDTKATV